VSTLKQSW